MSDLKQEMLDLAKAMPVLKGTLDRWAVELDREKAGAVRDAIDRARYNGSDGQGWESDLEQYLSELENQK